MDSSIDIEKIVRRLNDTDRDHIERARAETEVLNEILDRLKGVEQSLEHATGRLKVLEERRASGIATQAIMDRFEMLSIRLQKVEAGKAS